MVPTDEEILKAQHDELSASYKFAYDYIDLAKSKLLTLADSNSAYKDILTYLDGAQTEISYLKNQFQYGFGLSGSAFTVRELKNFLANSQDEDLINLDALRVLKA